MALNLISLDEAARILGISPELLNELRERQAIHGYRDGANWKFKRQDVERLRDDRASHAGEVSEESVEFLSLPLDIDDEDSSTDAVLFSERELGESGPSTSSTVIGRPGQLQPQESDIRLLDDADKQRQAGKSTGSDVRLVPTSDKSTPGSDVKLVPEQPPSAGSSSVGVGMDDLPLLDDDSELSIVLGSGVNLASASAIMPGRPTPTPPSPTTASDADLHTGTPSPAGSALSGLSLSPVDSGLGLSGSGLSLSGSGLGVAGSDVSLSPSPSAAGSSLALGAEDLNLDDIDLGEESSIGLAPSGTSNVKPRRGDSEINLDAGSEDLILPTSRSDISRGPSDSGIALRSPSDSGINLEDPIELSGVGEPPLELGEDPLLSLADDSDSNRLATLKESDEEFLLTPMEEARDAESEDSGSQVIALDSEEGGFSQEGLLDVDEGLAGSGAGLGGGLGMTPALAGGPAVGALASREIPYSVWQIISLGVCVFLLLLSGMMVHDLVRNMWSWRGPYAVNSSLMEFLAGLFG